MKYSASVCIGETASGLPEGIFFDPHTPIFNNKPPVITFFGAPGSGKTFALLTVTAANVIMGKTAIVLDPKGDFLALKNLEDEIGSFNIWDLGGNGQAGILDPFYMVDDPGEKLSLCVDVIDLFVGGLTENELTALSPIIKDVVTEPNPSLVRVLEELRGSTKEVARNLGTKLDLIRRLPISKLAFAPNAKGRQSIDITQGLTVVTMLGIDLPPTPEAAKATTSGRLASGILFLLMNFIRRVMKTDDTPNPKLLVIDEAWNFVNSDAGAKVVKEVALLGRSKAIAMILATQNNTHLEKIDIKNTVNSRFCFRSEKDEALGLIKDMGLPENEGFEQIITGLETGQCLYSDFMGRYSKVQIKTWRDDWAVKFNTNPLEKLKKAQEERKKKQNKK